MALVYESDSHSRKSRRGGASGRRRTTTNYDRYGYQITTLGPSAYTNGKDSIMHVLRVQPGVVVNFIETPSRGGRSRAAPRVVEYKSGRNDRHPWSGDESRDASWQTTHSPHSRPLDLVDKRSPPDSFGGLNAIPPPSPPLPPRSPPTTHHFVPDEFPPPLYRLGSHYTEPYHPEARYSSSDVHFVDAPESPQHVPSPIDIPFHPSSPDFSDYSLQSLSPASLDSTPFDYGHVDDRHYHDPPRSPSSVDMPIQISPSSRPRRRSFDVPNATMKPPSPVSPLHNGRTVRFRDDPVLPGPLERRKGWWNRKGDQLWDNDGSYVPAPEHNQYPSDLQNYPEPGTGWMNEEGTQIDIKHRLVRKRPLRSALKRPSL